MPDHARQPTPFERVLVGYVDTDRGADAAALGADLARLAGADLLLATIVPAVWIENPGERSGTAVVHSGARDGAAAALERAAAQLAGAPGLGHVERRLEASSSRGFGLHDLAETERADVVVLGSSHRGRIAQTALGTLADRMLHGAPCAVAVAPAGYASRERHEPAVIGVAFDGSPESRLALETAHTLAGRARCVLRVLTVLAPMPSIIQRWIPLTGTQEQELLDRGETAQHQEQVASSAIHEAVAKLPGEVSIISSVLGGDETARTIIDASAQDDVELLIMGSRGYGPLRRTLLGSVSAGVLRRAFMPVLVMPRGDGS